MKHPVLSNRNRLIIWWLVGLFLITSQSFVFYFASGSFSKIAILDSIFSLFIFSVIAFYFWYPFTFFNTGNVKFLTLVVNLIIAGAVTITIWILLTNFFMQVIIQEQNLFERYWQVTFPYRIGTSMFLYCVTILIYYLFINADNLSKKNAKEAELEKLVKEIELKMLQSQINPHFLFNSLNSISSLTISNPEKARRSEERRVGKECRSRWSPYH